MTASLILAACLGLAPPETDIDRAVVALIEVFRHPDARSTRLDESRRAIKALAAIGEPAVPKLLDAVLTEDDPAASYSGLALIDMPARETAAAVRARWDRAGPTARWKLVPHLTRLDFPAAARFALACLDEKDVGLRGEAWTFVIRNRKSPHVAAAKDRYLKALAGDELPPLRWYLLVGEPVFDAEKEADLLIGLLKPDSWAAKGEGQLQPPGHVPPWWPDGRVAVVGALGRRGVKRAAPALVDLLAEKGPGKAYLGHAVLPLLGEFGDKSAVPELKRVIAANPADLLPSVADPVHLRAEAARALWQLGDPAGRPVLAEQLKSDKWFHRRFAAEAFAKFGTADDLPAFAGMLDDPDWGVREAGSAGLERVTGAKVRGDRTRPTEADAPLWKEWLKNNTQPPAKPR